MIWRRGVDHFGERRCYLFADVFADHAQGNIA
jgi:hypothetical protein